MSKRWAPKLGERVRVRSGECHHRGDGSVGVVKTQRPNGLYEVWFDFPQHFPDGEKLLGVIRAADQLEPMGRNSCAKSRLTARRSTT